MTSLRQSMIAAYLTCPRRAQYRYVEGIREPSNERAARGTAAHAGIEYALRRKMLGTPTTLDEVAQATRDAVARVSSDVDWSREEPGDRDAMADRAIAYATHYVEHVAPGLDLVDVERQFQTTIGDIPVHGTIDVVCRTQLRDTKTTSRTPSPAWGDPRYRLQLGIYALAWQAMHDDFDAPQMSGAIDFLVLSERKPKGKEPTREVRHLPVIIDADEMRGEVAVARETVRHVASRVRVGDYPRNPTACFEWSRPCPYMGACQPHRASAVERAEAERGSDV